MSFSVLQKGGQIWRQNFHFTSRFRISSFATISRHYSPVILNPEHYNSLQRTRNIGIIAHIDAGKTTTTERMLYYSGFTRCIGDVDDGSTVTDFLPSERARGITIQSAAVTFNWPPITGNCGTRGNFQRSLFPHTINLIDTPGHADFTFEVLRSLRILDGAVCILDGVSGVEAQTEKVWTQAHRYKIPRIAYINKLDRVGATFERTVREIASRLHGVPVLCQIPWWEGGKGRFSGVGDAINLCALKWETESDGKKIQHFSLKELTIEDSEFCAELVKARTALVENLCEFDDQLLEIWLSVNDNSMAIPAQKIQESIRRCIIDGSGRLVPIYCGASFRNIGVQPLLDAIDDLLPDPTERPDPEIKIGSQESTLQDFLQGKLNLVPNSKKNLLKRRNDSFSLIKNIEACALAFKVVSDVHRGILVYIRVYSGCVKRNASLWNPNLQVTERPQRILQMQASDAVEIPHIEAGQIGAIVGLKQTRTGDTLLSYPNVNPKSGPPSPINELQLRPIDVPPPVFFAAIEPHSATEEKNVINLLSVLLREDPSLHLSIDEDSGQILLSGMGELHLEIARDRLVNNFKAQASMGNVEISYRECVLVPTLEQRFDYDREIAGKKVKASCTVCIGPIDENLTPEWAKMNKTIIHGGNSISVNVTSGIESIEADQILPYDLSYSVIRAALSNGAIAALARGPRRSYPLHNTHVIIKLDLETDLFGKETSTAALSLAAKLAVQAALRECLLKNQIAIMEPVMDVLISCDQATLGAVVHDLSAARGGQVVQLSSDDHDDAISCLPAVDPGKIYVPKDPFSNGVGESENLSLGQRRQVKARVPLKEMVGYLRHLRSLTAGRGTFIMNFDKFEKLVGSREKLI